jgi:hypothetical protein
MNRPLVFKKHIQFLFFNVFIAQDITSLDTKPGSPPDNVTGTPSGTDKILVFNSSTVIIGNEWT